MKLKLLPIMLMLVQMLWAQELRVTSFTPSTDVDASVHRVNDLNGQPCALVKVLVTDEVINAKGASVITLSNGKTFQKKDANEYWVYLAKGARHLTIATQSHLPLKVMFGDYGISTLESLTTYVLKLAKPSGMPDNTDTGKNYLIMEVKPANAIVHIDDALKSVSAEGIVMDYLSYGAHTYKVEAAGYAPQSGTVQVGSGERTTLNVQLTSTMARLNVSSTTAGTRIYVNNDLKGTGSWNGSLAAGSYLLEGRLDGHRPWSQSMTLAENDNRSVTIPALTAITGGLNVSYQPIDAEVLLDGTRIGTSPNVFNNIPVGSHRLTIKKSGYTDATVTVSVTEGNVTDVKGTLQAASSNSSYGNSSYGNTSSDESQTFTVGGVSFKMIKVEGGTFTMGGTAEQGSDAQSDESPTHRVTLSSYYIGETEVTQALWEAVMGSNPSNRKGRNLPVEKVSWEDCQNFVNKLNQMTGKNFRLPTEAEWEFAARGGNKSHNYKYSGSNDIDKIAWYDGNSGDTTHVVRTKSPNELGIYDMTGNVWEWCQDWYGDYSSYSQTNPIGPSSGSYRVNRGGGWNGNARRFCRVSNRGDCAPDFQGGILGLRLVLSDFINVQGHVYDAKNKEPMIGALATLLEDGKKTSTGRVTDFDGNFTIAVPAIGKHSVKISFVGYKDSIVDIDKSNNQKLEIPMRD